MLNVNLVMSSRERLSTYMFDTLRLKVLFLLNYESLKYIAKFFLSVYYTLFRQKIRKDIAKFVVCCGRDWSHKG